MMGKGSSGVVDNRNTPTETTKLQGVGNHPARQANDIRVGDTLVWNGGHTSQVVGMRRSGSQLTLNLRGEDGVVRERRVGRHRLLAVR